MKIGYVFLLLLLTSIVWSAGDDVRFNGYRISRDGIVKPDGTQMAPPAGKESAGRLRFAQVNGSITLEWKNRIKDRGIELIGYAPNRAYLVRLPYGGELSVGKGLEDTVFLPLLPEMKIDPAVSLPPCDDSIPLVVHLASSGDGEGIAEISTDVGATVAGIRLGKRPRIGLRVPVERVQALNEVLSNRDEVYYIERDLGVRLFNDDANSVIQSGLIGGPTKVWNQGIFGEGEIIAVLDTGIDADSCFFRDPSGTLPPANTFTGTIIEATRRKVIAVDFLYSSDNPLSPPDPDEPSDPLDWDNEGHGTSVAGCAGGSNIDYATSPGVKNGIAPLAKFVIQDGGFRIDNCSDLPALGCPVIDLNPVFQQVYDQGARIDNGSWGDRESEPIPRNTYTARCQDIDEFTWSHGDFLCVLAAGNDGDFEGAVASPGVAKNALSVAATRNGVNADQIASFSSRGPAADGRIKPDLCTPGTATTARSDGNVSTDNCDTRTASGTSFASPLTAGSAALVREYLRKGYYPSGTPTPQDSILNPSAALVKGMLINSAVDIPGASERVPAPDQGWGRIALEKSMFFPGSPHRLWLLDETAGFADVADAPFRIYFNVNSGIPFKATLVWSDYPAVVGVSPSLVNDLDLSVSLDGTNYWGNNLYEGNSTPDGDPDRLNNVEVVLIASPAPGTYKVEVIPFIIPEPTQGLALVVTGDFEVVGTASMDYWMSY